MIVHHGVLYQELQHRTANGLQSIASILSMQAARITDADDAAEALHDAASRLRAVAAVHAQLHHPELGNEGVAPALEGLVRDMLFGAGREDVALTVRIDPVSMPQRDAAMLAMLVAEAVQNALKHGLRGRMGGQLLIVLRKSEQNRHRLEVTDDGPGFPPTTPPGRRSLGMPIMEHLAQQLDGALRLDNIPASGARVLLDFDTRAA